jgi:hypothetical protein
LPTTRYVSALLTLIGTTFVLLAFTTGAPFMLAGGGGILACAVVIEALERTR